MDQASFDTMLDEYQAGLAEAEEEAHERSYAAARRPDADPSEVTFSELRLGDYMTAEGPSGRWVKVVAIEPREGKLSITFEIPEPLNWRSQETRYVIDRSPDERILIDRRARDA